MTTEFKLRLKKAISAAVVVAGYERGCRRKVRYGNGDPTVSLPPYQFARDRFLRAIWRSLIAEGNFLLATKKLRHCHAQVSHTLLTNQPPQA
jgi:hypothetical protein